MNEILELQNKVLSLISEGQTEAAFKATRQIDAYGSKYEKISSELRKKICRIEFMKKNTKSTAGNYCWHNTNYYLNVIIDYLLQEGSFSAFNHEKQHRPELYPYFDDEFYKAVEFLKLDKKIVIDRIFDFAFDKLPNQFGFTDEILNNTNFYELMNIKRGISEVKIELVKAKAQSAIDGFFKKDY